MAAENDDGWVTAPPAGAFPVYRPGLDAQIEKWTGLISSEGGGGTKFIGVVNSGCRIQSF